MDEAHRFTDVMGPIAEELSSEMVGTGNTGQPTASMTQSCQTPHKHTTRHLEPHRTPNARPHHSSPFFQTPSSGRSGGRKSSSRFSARICSDSSTPHSHAVTPSSHRVYNPFDNMDNLHKPVFSPNVFATTASPEEASKEFHWSIEHLAILHPVDIDEMPVHQHCTPKLDSELEERAQQAIESYFNTHMIAPSPWTDSAKKRPFVLPHTPCTPATYPTGSPFTPRSQDKPPGIQGKSEKPTSSTRKQDIGVQTMLTLPVHFDLQKILGEYYTNNEEGNAELSTSSLRRKLFFHGDEDVPPSPVQSVQLESSPHVSPIRCRTPTKHNHHSQFDTPGSNQFSSSPISGCGAGLMVTPGLRRSSTAPDLMPSPPLSPIISKCSQQRSGRHPSGGSTPLCKPLQATPSTGTRSVALSSPGMSPICSDFDDKFHGRGHIAGRHPSDGSTPLSQPLQATPSSGLQSMPLSSPGMSPIQSRSFSEEVFISKPHSSGRRSKCHRTSMEWVKPPQELHPGYHSDSEAGEEDNNMPYCPANDDGSSNRSRHGMDVERNEDAMECSLIEHSHMLQRIRSHFSSNRVGLTLPMDMIDIGTDDLTFPSESQLQTAGFTSTSQDTGYNTNSLQLTSQEGGLHSNLTNQLASLPLSSQDTGIDTELDQSASMTSLCQPGHEEFDPIEASSSGRPFSELANLDRPLDGDEIVQRAKEVLARLNNNGSTKQSSGVHFDSEVFQKGVQDPAKKAGTQLLWKPVTATVPTPHRQRYQELGVLRDTEAAKYVKPSQLASEVLWRAGKDYTRYCITPPPPLVEADEEVTPPGVHVANLCPQDPNNQLLVQ